MWIRLLLSFKGGQDRRMSFLFIKRRLDKMNEKSIIPPPSTPTTYRLIGNTEWVIGNRNSYKIIYFLDSFSGKEFYMRL